MHEVQDEAEKTPQSRRNSSSRANTVLICSKRKLPECFKVDSRQQKISKTLNIAKLSPFIEKDGTIRVKVRLKHSNLDYNAKHLILLTAKHPVVQLLLEKAHRDNLHQGTDYVRNLLQQ